MQVQFSHSLIVWMEACFNSVVYVALINGIAVDFIHPSRGLRQTFPLFPPLVLLVVEGLNMLIKQRLRGEDRKGVKVAKGTIITHLMFVDYLLSSGNVTVAEAKNHGGVLNLFWGTTGMEINLRNSSIRFSHFSQAQRKMILRFLPFTVQNFEHKISLDFHFKPDNYRYRDWTWLI